MRTIGMIIAAAALAAAAPAGFSFRAIEFAPAETRLPAARAFVARVAAPGTPMANAVRAIEHADAHCRRPRAPGGTIECLSSRPMQYSAEGSLLDDVTWTVRLRPAADGTVASADVARGRFGT